MAVVNLGNRELFTGQGFVQYNEFDYDQTQAYRMVFTFETENFDTLYSYLMCHFELDTDGLGIQRIQPEFRLDIYPNANLFYFPCSTLFGGNGTARLNVTRTAVFRDGADGQPLEGRLFYEDENTTPTWF